jgi:hypothetical protein
MRAGRSQGSKKKVEQVFNLFGKRDRMGERQNTPGEAVEACRIIEGTICQSVVA